MIKVGDWVVVQGLSDYKDYREGEVTRLHINSQLVDVWIEESQDKWTINKKYLRKVKKEVTKEEYINAALDLIHEDMPNNDWKEWLMSLTGEHND